MAATFRAGDWVEVKGADEIGKTLDGEGTLDGLPFMPEMLEYCGRRFRLLRQAQKTCIELAAGDYRVREFRNNDVFLLQDLRCHGAHHGGCQRGCMVFWKMAWLRKVNNGDSATPSLPAFRETLLSNLKTMTSPGRYYCQSTELVRATESKPLTRSRILLKCFYDLRSGASGVFEMLGLIAKPLILKTADRFFGRRRLLGSLTRTPVGTLGLQPGETVEIKSLKEMQETLDNKGRNRGLVCDIELKPFCGKKYKVRSRIECMISEPSGEMRKVESTVVLEGIRPPS